MKQSIINAERRATGGGNECALKLNKIEEATLNLINPISISGHMESMESDVQIQPETEVKFQINFILKWNGVEFVKVEFVQSLL